MLSLLKRIVGRYRGQLYHEANVEGHKVVICVGREEAKATELFSLFSTRLLSIWPELFSRLKSGFADYGHAEEFPPDLFFFNISRMKSDLYMGDQSSFHIRLEIDTEKFSDKLCIYDFFLDEDLRVVHHQPVF